MKLLSVIAVCLLCSASTVRGGVLVQFKMMDKLGTIDVELFEQDKPVTVNNFLAYIKAGHWHDMVSHRWLPGFVLQGGGFKVPHRDDLMTSWNANPDTITPFGTIPFEKDTNRFFSNVFGTLAMARFGTDTNSAGSNWFFNLKDNNTAPDNLDTNDFGYTVFGRTLRGTNILNVFVPPSGNTTIFNIQGTDIPVFTDDPQRVNVYYITMDITVLTARIAPSRVAGGGYQISWKSVKDRPNIVEYTRVFPPQWQTVQTVTGTGADLSIVDSSTDSFRHYRVRIDYSN